MRALRWPWRHGEADDCSECPVAVPTIEQLLEARKIIEERERLARYRQTWGSADD